MKNFKWMQLLYRMFAVTKMDFCAGFGHRLQKETENKKEVLHILANGPSLNDTIGYIDIIGGDIMMMNYMFKQEYYKQYPPKYLCFFDSVFLNDSELEFELKRLTECNSATKVFFTHGMFVKYYNLFNNKNFFWIYPGGSHNRYTNKLDKFMYEKNYSSPMTYTVALAALYAGIQMGYKTIYLHGNDFSFITKYYVDEHNQTYFVNQHSYDKKTERKKMNISMLEEIETVYYSYVGYDNVAKYAKDERVSIYNLSLHSYIDSFEKLDVNKEVRPI